MVCTAYVRSPGQGAVVAHAFAYRFYRSVGRPHDAGDDFCCCLVSVNVFWYTDIEI